MRSKCIILKGVLGVIGDLFESLVKRAGFAKDSGIFFPGTSFIHLSNRRDISVILVLGSLDDFANSPFPSFPHC